MRAILMLVLALALLAAMLVAQNRPAKTLDIYVMDVEGGDSQLYVASSGESVLIDTGNAGAAAVRDADRIMAAVRDAGLKQIDHLITTHYHGDHIVAFWNSRNASLFKSSSIMDPMSSRPLRSIRSWSSTRC